MGIDSLRLGQHPGGHFPELLHEPPPSMRSYIGCRYCRLDRSQWLGAAPCPSSSRPEAAAPPVPAVVAKAVAEVLATTPQPSPLPGGRPVVPDLVELLVARRAFGERKYGVELHTHNGRDAYLDALQELLDLFVYLHQAQLEAAELRAENERLKNMAAAAQERVDFLLAAGAGGPLA